MLHIHWARRSYWCVSCAQVFPTALGSDLKFTTLSKTGEAIYFKRSCDFDNIFWGGFHRQMWLLGSTSQVMMMDERLSPSARSVQSPGDNPSTIHSIDAILGFKEDTIFHKSGPYSMTEKILVKEAERNVIVSPLKKSHSSESFDSKWIQFSSRFLYQVNLSIKLYSQEAM